MSARAWIELACLVCFFCVGMVAGLTMGFSSGQSKACSDLFGKSARYIEGRCYIASPDGSLVPAKGAK